MMEVNLSDLGTLADCLKLELNPDCFQEEPVPSSTTAEGSGTTSTSTEGSGTTSTSTSTTTTDKPDDGEDSGTLGLTVSKLLLLSSALLYAMVV
jgi:hypothetical protein